MNKLNQIIAVRVTAEDKKSLEEIAVANDLSKSEIIRDNIKSFLKDYAGGIY